MTLLLALLSPPTGDEAKSDEIDWLLSAPWASMALMVFAAVVVLFAGSVLARARKRKSVLHARPNFDLDVARMEALPTADPKTATAGPVHFEGVLLSSVGSLGGPPERACIYQNRAGASRDAAVASELVVVQCEGGRIALENLENARVLAPKQASGADKDRKVIRLCLGDRVQLLGVFSPEVSCDASDPEATVYGALGQTGQAQVRVLEQAERTENT